MNNSLADRLIVLRRHEQEIHKYPTSSKWYTGLSKAISFFELAETSSNPLDRFRNVWSSLYNLFILYGKAGEDEINRYHLWIQDTINLPDLRRIVQSQNWLPFLESVEKAKKTLLFDSHKNRVREGNGLIESWQKALQTKPSTNDTKTIQHFFLIIKDIRNAVSHPDFNPSASATKKALQFSADYLFPCVEVAIRAMIEKPIEGTTGKATAYRSLLWPFVKNSDSFFSDYYLERLFLKEELEDDFPYDIARTRLLPKLVKEYVAEKHTLLVADTNETKEKWFEQVLANILGIRLEKNVRIVAEDGVYEPSYVIAKSDYVSNIKSDYSGKDASTEIICLAWVLSWRDDLDSIPIGFDTFPMELVSKALIKSDVPWAILTNGRKIRLLSKTSAHKPRCFLEIDLAAIIDRERDPASVLAFRYFLGLFSGSSFTEADEQNHTRLERVQIGSERHGKEISDELKENVYHALAELGDGFLSFLRSNPNELAFWKRECAPSLSDNDFLASEQLLTDIYHESLSLMYRMLFLFYAESRDLLPMDNEIYRDSYSLESIRDDIISVYDDPDKSRKFFSEGSTRLWDILKELFGLVNGGKNLGGDSVPAYNGGLFDPQKHVFLEHCKVSDKYLARAIDLLSRTRPKQGQSRKKVTYRDLDIRHLGSIYEGILEYFAQIADKDLAIMKRKDGSSSYEEFVLVSELSKSEKEQLDEYLKAIAEDPENAQLPRNSKIAGYKKTGQYFLVYGGRGSKRKSSGSYYTPDYIVQYIVENTLGPLVRGECRPKTEPATEQETLLSFLPPENLPIGPLSAKEISELKVLDPAMGSGHFLVAATEYLARAYGDALIREGKDADGKMSDDEFVRYKRIVAERCIYGVDINPMSVELAKLSMWLFTMDKGRPLSFLDHHLKCGNSLIGTKVEELGGSLFIPRFREKVPLMIKDILGITQQETLTFKDIEAKKALDQGVENIKLPLKNVADMWVGRFFGEKESENYVAMLTNPELARNIKSRVTVEYKFFHWQFEFPEVFFDEYGRELDSAGFDVIVGNPPYVRQEGLGEFKQYFQKNYDVYHGVADLYVYFVEQGVSLLKKQGILGIIISNKWMRANYGKPIRNLLKQKYIEEIIDFGDLPVFEGATTYPCIVRVSNKPSSNTFSFIEVKTLSFSKLDSYVDDNKYFIDIRQLDENSWSLVVESKQELLTKFRSLGIPLEKYVKKQIYRGILTGFNEAFLIDTETKNRLIDEDPKSSEIIKPFLTGKDVKRYQPPQNECYIIFTRRGINIEEYPAINRHLISFKGRLTPKPKDWTGNNWGGRKSGAYKWYEIQDTVDYFQVFEKPKIIIPAIVQKASYTFDTSSFYSNDKTSIISTDDLYLLGVLNSRVLDYFIHQISSTKRGGYFEQKPMYISQLPIRTINFSDPIDKSQHDQMVKLVKHMLDLHKQLSSIKEQQKPIIQRQIDETDKQIDGLVYQLYGLTDEEIAIVEAATK